MNKTLFIIVIVLFAFVSGIIVAKFLFAIDIDILALPYSNRNVVVVKDIDIIQDNITIRIPKGARMILTRELSTTDEYSIKINAFMIGHDIIRPINAKPKYFDLRIPSNTLEKNLPVKDR